MIFTGMSLKALALFFGSSFIVFLISVSLSSRKLNISLLLKCFLIFLVEWFLKCLNKCFRFFFFQSRRCLFNLIIFVKFVKYLYKVCDIFLLSLTILLFLWRMIVLAVLLLIETRDFTVFQNFLVSVKLLKFKLLKYCCFAFLRTFVLLLIKVNSPYYKIKK